MVIETVAAGLGMPGLPARGAGAAACSVASHAAARCGWHAGDEIVLDQIVMEVP